MDSTNQQNNPNDIEENSSRSTEVGTTDETIISANQVHSEEDQPKKLKNTSIKTANKKRVFADTRFRVVAIIGLVVVGGLGFFMFNPMGKSDQLALDNQVAIATPEIQGQGTNVIPPEYVEYERQKQAEEAAQAGKNGESYLPEFKTVATQDPNGDLNDQNFITGPNGQPVNGSAKGGTPNITLELDQMARANMANQGGAYGGALPQPTSGGLPQQPQAQNGANQNAPIYQTNYAQQYEHASSAANDVASVYSQQAAANAERNVATRELSQTAFVDQLAAFSNTKNKVNGYSTYKYSHNTKASEGQQNLGSLNVAKTTSESTKGLAIIKAGTTMKARLDTGVNTDKGKNLFATVIGGKFNGAKLIGTVGLNTADIEFNFTRMLFKGEEYAIQVRALTLGTKQSGMADKVQKHTLQKLGGMVTAGIFEGYGQAYQNIGTTQITNTGNVVSTKEEPNDKEIAGNIIGNVGTEMANMARTSTVRPTTYIVNSGKVFEVFFDADVTTPKSKG
ncbi:hypothetical protein N5J54_13350 [Acinetobacter ursingii]|uniref:DotG/IcmE/VirB10 family protein n=1 Tax=Acinetobacter ursingii TaxID=108980 RepID=UPI00244D4A47|nr:DotG/IcmE/VirB10 family protein [Acinetobacter ursingii]MDH2104702.1 hypothetical protein [Acinetobacter ursingii]